MLAILSSSSFECFAVYDFLDIFIKSFKKEAYTYMVFKRTRLIPYVFIVPQLSLQLQNLV